MLLDDMPILPIYTYTSNYLINSAVKNYDSNLMNHSVYKDIFLEPALPQAAQGME